MDDKQRLERQIPRSLPGAKGEFVLQAHYIHHMDKSAFMAALTAELEKTRASIAELRDLTEPVAPDVAIGRISRMDSINNKAINDAALRKAEEKLQQLERMTVLVDEPGFGLCKKCGGTIPMQRLILMPQSVFCVRCAS